MPDEKNSSGFSEEELKAAGFTDASAPPKDDFALTPPSSPEVGSSEKPKDVFGAKDEKPESEPNEGQPASPPAREGKLKMHHIGGPSGGKDLNDEQYEEFLKKSREVQESIGNRQLGDLGPNDIYWEKKKELEKFIGSL